MSKTGYINGDDLLLKFGNNDLGHATTHTTTYTTETKERNVKPASTNAITAALFSEQTVSKLDIQIEASGMRCWDESGAGYKTLLDAWHSGKPVTVSAIERKEDSDDTVSPYLVGSFIIKSLKETAPSKDDATYDISLQITGAPTTWNLTNVTGETLPTA